jgi:hypothetical protein
MLSEEQVFKKKLGEISSWLDKYAFDKKIHRDLDVLIAIIENTKTVNPEENQQESENLTFKTHINEWRKLIINGDIKQVLDLMLDCCKKYNILEKWHDEIILLNSSFNRTSGDERIGIVSNQDAEIKVSKVAKNILEIIKLIEYSIGDNN